MTPTDEQHRSDARARYHANRDWHLAWRRANSETERRQRKKRIEDVRRHMFAMLGAQCELCGDSERQHLTFDHRFGDGWKDRAFPGGARGLWSVKKILARIARGEDSLERYRILCWNCNCSIGIRGWSPVEATQGLYCREYLQ